MCSSIVASRGVPSSSIFTKLRIIIISRRFRNPETAPGCKPVVVLPARPRSGGALLADVNDVKQTYDSRGVGVRSSAVVHVCWCSEWARVFCSCARRSSLSCPIDVGGHDLGGDIDARRVFAKHGNYMICSNNYLREQSVDQHTLKHKGKNGYPVDGVAVAALVPDILLPSVQTAKQTVQRSFRLRNRRRFVRSCNGSAGGSRKRGGGRRGGPGSRRGTRRGRGTRRAPLRLETSELGANLRTGCTPLPANLRTGCTPGSAGGIICIRRIAIFLVRVSRRPRDSVPVRGINKEQEKIDKEKSTRHGKKTRKNVSCLRHFLLMGTLIVCLLSISYADASDSVLC